MENHKKSSMTSTNINKTKTMNDDEEYLNAYKDHDSPYSNLYFRFIIAEYGDESYQAKKEGIGMFDEKYRDWINKKELLKTIKGVMKEGDVLRVYDGDLVEEVKKKMKTANFNYYVI